MIVYLGNWASHADWECARDDGPDCVEDMAWPTGVVLVGNGPGHVKRLLDMAWNDCADMWNEEDGPLPDPDWEETEAWEVTGKRRRWWSDTFECMVVLVATEPLEPTGGPE